MESFIQLIMKNLEANGFPGKKVALPLETLYEKADEKGLNFNKVREALKSEHSIETLIETERVVFTKITTAQPSKDDMMKQAQEAMANMSPEQLQQMQQMFMNMSEDEKAEIMRKGREMGLI